jgi:hypothetical protein
MLKSLALGILGLVSATALLGQSCRQGTTRTPTSYGSYCAPNPEVAAGSAAQITCTSPSTEVTLHGSATPSLPVLDILRCGEQVSVLEKDGEWYKVHMQSGKDGYVREIFVASRVPVPENPASAQAFAVVKEIPSDTALKTPSRMPTNPGQTQSYSDSGEYPFSLRVLQTEQVPYSVQYGGGGVSTNCSISGSTYTTGSATSVGNYAYGSAISNTDLAMHCNSYENPPMQWRHVLNAMLVVASNGIGAMIPEPNRNRARHLSYCD